MKFEERYKTLNSAQKKAVDTIEGPVMVIAGPGTGKTTILTLRIANILRKTDTPPSGILAITFTEAGVKAMKSKLREIIGSRAEEIRIHTFHGFASSIISEFPDHFVHLERARQITDVESEALLREILKEKEFFKLRPLGNPDFYIAPIMGAIRDAKKDALTPQMVGAYSKDEIERIQSDENSISSRGTSKGSLKAEAKKRIEKCERTIVFASLYERYEALKKEKNLIDFDDLIFELLTAFSRDDLLKSLIQEKFLYILVDEHQDTNDAQNAIIKAIADFYPNPNVFIVGDEKQAIYRFQGASVKNFLQFKNIWSSVELISLKENYRSGQAILDASFGMIEQNYKAGENEELRVKLKAKNDSEKQLVEIIKAPNAQSADIFLTEEIIGILEKYPKATIALIAKKNRNVERIISLLEDCGIPAAAERSIDIFSHPIGIVFFSLLEFVNDPLRLDALATTLVSGMWNTTFEENTSLLKLIKQNDVSRLSSELPQIEKIKHILLEESPVGSLLQIAGLSGFNDLLLKDPAFVEVWRGIINLAESIVKSGAAATPQELIRHLLSFKASAKERSIKVQVGVPEGAVKVMTVHGSKGLEFDYVYLPDCTEESWSLRGRPNFFVFPTESRDEDEEIRDNRRLFYVALTRARNKVSLIVPLQDKTGEMLRELRFISDLDSSATSIVSIENTDAKKLSKVRELSKENVWEKKIIDQAKRVLIQKGLSVTALNHFLKCPNEFIYKSILKLPEAPNPNAEKGTAMHRALHKVWGLAERDRSSIEVSLRAEVESYMQQSFLALHEKEAVLEELLKNIPSVASSLEHHFLSQGNIFSETWLQTIFSYGEIQIPLHGQLDLVIDSGKEISVFDYKTRGKMSENQIKGETKKALVSGDQGKYFRQLVFYSLLLQDDIRFKGKQVKSSLVFLTPDDKGVCHVSTFDVSENDKKLLIDNIKNLIDAVWSGKIISLGCNENDCTSCSLRRLQGKF